MIYSIKTVLLITTLLGSATAVTGVAGYYIYGKISQTDKGVSIDVEIGLEPVKPKEETVVTDNVDSSEAEAEADKLAQALAVLTASKDEKNQSLEAEETAKTMLTSAVAESDKKIQEFTQQASEFTHTISEKTQKQQELTQAIATENAKLPASEQAVADAVAAIRQTQSSLTTAATHKQTAFSQYQSKEEWIVELRSITARALRNKTLHAASIAEQKEKIKNARWPALQALRQQLRVLESRTVSINMSYADAAADEANALQELNAFQQTMQQREDAYVAALDKHNESLRTNNEAEAAKTAIDTKITELTQEKGEVEKAIEAAAASKSVMEQKISKEQATKQQLDTEIVAKNQLIKGLTAEIADLQEQIEKLVAA